MKLVPLVLLCLFSTTLLGQLGKDTTENLIANWKKGEIKTVSIIRTKEKTEAGQGDPPFKLFYKATITVLDSSQDGYKMRWIFQLDEDYKKKNPGVELVMPVYNGLEFLFTTTETGQFKELLNWEEVRDAYADMASASIPKSDNVKVRAALDQAKMMFNTKQMVESALIKEIQLYHGAYGGEFSTKGLHSSVLLPNVFGGEPMPAIITQQLNAVNEVKKSFTVTIRQELDSTGMHIMMNSIFKTMKVPMDSVDLYAKELLADFQLTDLNEYQVIKPGYWITDLKNSRIIDMGQIKQVEVFIFRMEH